MPPVAEDVASADAVAIQQLQHSQPGKLNSLVDAALQSMLSTPTVAALACRLASAGGWPSLQRLAAAGCIPSLVLAPGLLPAATEAGQHALLTSMLQHCVDVGADDLAATLCMLLGGGKAAKGLANGHEMSTPDEGDRGGNAISAHGMAHWPAPLHAMVRAKHDQAVLLQALRKLQAEQVMRLGEYLAAVLAEQAAEGGGPLPSLAATTAWASALLDAQYTTIVLQVWRLCFTQ